MNSVIEATVYVAAVDWVIDNLKPERVYLNHLLAAKDFLSEGYFKNLEATETID